MGDRVKHWITHNEPWVTAYLGHAYGVHAPGISDMKMAVQVCHHLLVSHGMLVPRIRAHAPGAQVGITLSLHPQIPASASAADAAAAQRHDGLRNRWFLDPLYGRGYPADALALLGDLAPKVLAGDMATIAVQTDFLASTTTFQKWWPMRRATGWRRSSWSTAKGRAHRLRLGGLAAGPGGSVRARAP